MNERKVSQHLCHSVLHDSVAIQTARRSLHMPLSPCLAAAGTESPDFQHGLQTTTVSPRQSTRINEDQRGSWNRIGTYHWVHNVHIMFIYVMISTYEHVHQEFASAIKLETVFLISNQKSVPSPAQTSHKSSGRPPGTQERGSKCWQMAAACSNPPWFTEPSSE